MKKTILKTTLTVFISFSFLTKAQNIYTYAGAFQQGFAGDGGPAINAQLNIPFGVAVDAIGNVFFSDRDNHRIRKISPTGIITTIAGTGSPGFSGDGGLATSAQLHYPYGITIDASGNLYVADKNNERIRKITTSGIISTYAGNGTAGFSGDGGLATLAELNSPRAVAMDASGNLFIADLGNHWIRKVNSSGIISQYAGLGIAGFSGDGGNAISAKLNSPYGLAVDASGNLYISDFNNYRIRMVNTSGIISTVVGNGIQGFGGDGGQAINAQLNNAGGIHIDPSGNLLIADGANQRIRKVNTSGVISTIAGNGSFGFSGDGGIATNAKLYFPTSVVSNSNGEIFIADANNNRIRVLCPSSCFAGIASEFFLKNNIELYPNPNNGNFKLVSPGGKFTEIKLYNSLGQIIFFQTDISNSDINFSLEEKGLFLLAVTIEDKIYNKRILIE